MISITKPTEEDFAGIQEVFYRTWLATYPNREFGITREDIEERYSNRLSPETLEKRKHDLFNSSENQLFLVAKDGNKVVGVCKFFRRESVNQLQALYVLPEYQGRGIGHMFWQEVLFFLDPQKPTVANVATYNNKAIAFYKKLGFVDSGKRFTEERLKMKSGATIPEMEMVLKRHE